MPDNLDLSSEESAWIKNMERARSVEFWTGYPNKPAPTTEEKIRIIAERRLNPALFQEILSCYSLPRDISDETLIDWQGEGLIQE